LPLVPNTNRSNRQSPEVEMTDALLVAVEIFCATHTLKPSSCFKDLMKCAAINGSYDEDKNPTQVVIQCKMDYLEKKK
jgi:hypothetical protein